jgi:hypothetical protein
MGVVSMAAVFCLYWVAPQANRDLPLLKGVATGSQQAAVGGKRSGRGSSGGSRGQHSRGAVGADAA